MKLKILIADDQEINRLLLSKISTLQGHQVFLAENGREAIEQFTEHTPDLVLMDVMMPEVDGLTTTSIIKAMHPERWIPVIVLSALSEQDDIIRGLKAGADDYITKPLQVDILIAKLGNFERSITAQRQLEHQNEELRRYRFITEDEKRIASHLMQSLVDIKRLQLPGVEWWLQAADAFSGDVLAAAPTPAGVLHVMLSDGTGHGLAAALSAQPLPEIFYSMTARGHTIGSIAREINLRIGRLMPIDRFFAATMVAIDPREQMIEVWNGGNPSTLLIEHDGTLHHAFESRHVSLGIIRNGEFNSDTERIPYPPGAQLVMMSNGLMDACQTNLAAHDMNLTAQLLAGVAPSDRLKSIRQSVLDQLAGSPALDDISLFVISTDLLENDGIDNTRPLSTMLTPVTNEAWRFKLLLNGGQLQRMSQEVVPFVAGALERLSCSEQHRGILFLILSELFNNCLDHALLGMDSRLKNEEDGFDKYLNLRASRLQALDNAAFIELEVNMNGSNAIIVVIRDSSAGFDHASVMQQSMNTNTSHGRGLALIQALGARLEYSEAGNEVRAYV